MFGIHAGLGEIGVGVFNHGILVPMAELALHARIPFLLRIFGFDCALHQILIGFFMGQDGTSYELWGR